MFRNLLPDQKSSLLEHFNRVARCFYIGFPCDVNDKVIHLELENDCLYLKIAGRRTEIVDQRDEGIRAKLEELAPFVLPVLLDAYEDFLNERYKQTVWRFRKDTDRLTLSVYKKDDPSWSYHQNWLFDYETAVRFLPHEDLNSLFYSILECRNFDQVALEPEISP